MGEVFWAVFVIWEYKFEGWRENKKNTKDKGSQLVTVPAVGSGVPVMIHLWNEQLCSDSLLWCNPLLQNWVAWYYLLVLLSFDIMDEEYRKGSTGLFPFDLCIFSWDSWDRMIPLQEVSLLTCVAPLWSLASLSTWSDILQVLTMWLELLNSGFRIVGLLVWWLRAPRNKGRSCHCS